MMASSDDDRNSHGIDGHAIALQISLGFHGWRKPNEYAGWKSSLKVTNELGLWLLLSEAMKGTKPPDQFHRIYSNDPAVREC